MRYTVCRSVNARDYKSKLQILIFSLFWDRNIIYPNISLRYPSSTVKPSAMVFSVVTGWLKHFKRNESHERVLGNICKRLRKKSVIRR